jgi:hypothetical protein
MTPHSEERVKTLTARLKRVIRCANDRMVDDMRTVLRNAHLSHENVRLREDLDEARAERDRLQQALEEKALTLAAFQVPGPDVVTAPQVTRWVDRLSALLRDEP